MGNPDKDFSAVVHDLLGPCTSVRTPSFLTGSILRTASVERRPGRIRLAFSSAAGVASFMEYLEDYKNDNDDIDLEFDPDLLDFEPSDTLLKKSKNPLWVVRPVDATTVMIERVWQQ